MNAVNGNLTISLKFIISYFLLYGIFTEYLVVIHWDEWLAAVVGKSLGYALGYSMKGPFLGVLFILSGIGLSNKRLWARKVAVIALFFAVLTDGNSFAWGFANGKPSKELLLASFLAVFLWNSIWLGLLFKKSTSELLQ